MMSADAAGMVELLLAAQVADMHARYVCSAGVRC